MIVSKNTQKMPNSILASRKTYTKQILNVMRVYTLILPANNGPRLQLNAMVNTQCKE